MSQEKTLIIKGTAHQATEAARVRGIKLRIGKVTDKKETIGFSDADEDTLNKWFLEDRTPPFPDGSLLFWCIKPDFPYDVPGLGPEELNEGRS